MGTIQRKLPTSYTLFDPPYGTDLPVEQLFVILFDKIPSTYEDNTVSYDPSLTTYLLDNGFIEEIKNFSNNRRREPTSSSLFVNESLQMIVRVSGSIDKTKNNLLKVIFYYSIKNGKEIYELIDFEKLKTIERLKKKSNISLVKSEMGHLDTEEFDLYIPPMDLELNYGTEFLNVHETIVSNLNITNGKGIILLHGDPGTGKTSYIKYLTSLIKEKEILFVPPSMAEMISEPNIIPFLMEYKNSILIIEDAERVISDRDGKGSPAGVSNILNLTDGILGDCLGIQILATFNMKREKIDQALLRKGRLIAEHKFEKLKVDDTNNLLKHLNKDIIVNESMCLADIYNIDVELHKTKENKSKIGF
jgi:SpoVK/Ycf46/Vps4 family AAA+-type ATPase